MYNIIDDLSALLNIPKKDLRKVGNEIAYCICEDVEQSVIGKETLTEIDLGIGVLAIKVDGGNLLYRFTPVKQLDNAIRKTIETGHSPLQDQVENALKKHLLDAYKSFF